MVLDYKRRSISFDEYVRMGEAGIFGEGERVELIAGDLAVMWSTSPAHNSAVGRLNASITPCLAGRAIVWVQQSIVLDRSSAPILDITILRYDATSYSKRYVGVPDIVALIEVGDTSRAFDRGMKRDLYARHMIAELWLVDLVDSTVTICREPRNGRYHVDRVARAGESIAFQAFAQDAFDTDEILVTLAHSRRKLSLRDGGRAQI